MKATKMFKWQIRIFILCWVAYACIYFGRVNLSVAIPELQNSFGWSKSQVGLIGSIFFWIYGTGQLINGYLGDKVSSRKFIFIGLFVTACANMAFGFTASIVVMCILWGINGYFQSMLWGPMVKMLSNWYPNEKSSRTAISISTSMVGGYLLAWGLAGSLINYAGWKWTFWVPGLFIMVFSLVWFFRVKDRPEDIGLVSPNAVKDEVTNEIIEESNKLSLIEVIKRTKLWYVVIACFAQGIIKDGIGLWGPTFLMETHGINMKATTSLIIFIPFMNFAGMMVAGYINKKFKYREKLTVVSLFVVGIVMIGALIKFGTINIFFGVMFLGLASAMMFGANTLLLGVVPLSFHKYGRVSSVAGFLDFCAYLAAGFTGILTGKIVDLFGWNGLLTVWVFLCAIGSLALLIDYFKQRLNNVEGRKWVKNVTE